MNPLFSLSPLNMNIITAEIFLVVKFLSVAEKSQQG